MKIGRHIRNGVEIPPPSGRTAKRRPVGLGDVVEMAAAPVARWLDTKTARLGGRWRTKLAVCSACSARRRRLNGWVSDVRSLRAWLKPLKALLSRPSKHP